MFRNGRKGFANESPNTSKYHLKFVDVFVIKNILTWATGRSVYYISTAYMPCSTSNGFNVQRTWLVSQYCSNIKFEFEELQYKLAGFGVNYAEINTCKSRQINGKSLKYSFFCLSLINALNLMHRLIGIGFTNGFLSGIENATRRDESRTNINIVHISRDTATWMNCHRFDFADDASAFIPNCINGCNAWNV